MNFEISQNQGIFLHNNLSSYLLKAILKCPYFLSTPDTKTWM